MALQTTRLLQDHRLRVGVRRRTEPDVAKADLQAVVLQPQRTARLGRRLDRPLGRPVESAVFDDLGAVEDDGNMPLFLHLAGNVEARRLEGDVQRLPSTRFLAGVHRRRNQTVDCAGGVQAGRFELGRIGNLHLVAILKKDAAVVAHEAPARHRLERQLELHVILAVAERRLGLDVALARHDLNVTILDRPRRRSAIARLPGGEDPCRRRARRHP